MPPHRVRPQASTPQEAPQHTQRTAEADAAALRAGSAREAANQATAQRDWALAEADHCTARQGRIEQLVSS